MKAKGKTPSSMSRAKHKHQRTGWRDVFQSWLVVCSETPRKGEEKYLFQAKTVVRPESKNPAFLTDGNV